MVAAAKKLAAELEGAKRGEIKKRAKEIKTDHGLAMALWKSGTVPDRLLATLIFDKKQHDQKAIEKLAKDLLEHDEADRGKISVAARESAHNCTPPYLPEFIEVAKRKA